MNRISKIINQFLYGSLEETEPSLIRGLWEGEYSYSIKPKKGKNCFKFSMEISDANDKEVIGIIIDEEENNTATIFGKVLKYSRLKFVKTYNGMWYIDRYNNKQRFSEKIIINYSGKISNNGNSISGSWRMDATESYKLLGSSMSINEKAIDQSGSWNAKKVKP